MTVELVALLGALAVIGLVFVYTLISGSPPTPTSPRVLTAAMRLLPRRLPGEHYRSVLVMLPNFFDKRELKISLKHVPTRSLFSTARLAESSKQHKSQTKVSPQQFSTREADIGVATFAAEAPARFAEGLVA